MPSHVRVILDTNSPYIGRICPSKRIKLQPNHEIALCTKTDTPVSIEAWQEYLPTAWHNTCPYCHLPVLHVLYWRNQ